MRARALAAVLVLALAAAGCVAYFQPHLASDGESVYLVLSGFSVEGTDEPRMFCGVHRAARGSDLSRWEPVLGRIQGFPVAAFALEGPERPAAPAPGREAREGRGGPKGRAGRLLLVFASRLALYDLGSSAKEGGPDWWTEPYPFSWRVAAAARWEGPASAPAAAGEPTGPAAPAGLPRGADWAAPPIAALGWDARGRLVGAFRRPEGAWATLPPLPTPTLPSPSPARPPLKGGKPASVSPAVPSGASDAEGRTEGLPEACAAAGPGGRLYVVWRDRAPGASLGARGDVRPLRWARFDGTAWQTEASPASGLPPLPEAGAGASDFTLAAVSLPGPPGPSGPSGERRTGLALVLRSRRTPSGGSRSGDRPPGSAGGLQVAYFDGVGWSPCETVRPPRRSVAMGLVPRLALADLGAEGLLLACARDDGVDLYRREALAELPAGAAEAPGAPGAAEAVAWREVPDLAGVAKGTARWFLLGGLAIAGVLIVSGLVLALRRRRAALEGRMEAVPKNLLLRRGTAFLLDASVVFVPALLLAEAAFRRLAAPGAPGASGAGAAGGSGGPSGLGEALGASEAADGLAGAVLPILAAHALYVLYGTIAEFLTGQTLGKWLLGLRVEALDGGRPSIGQVLVRNLLRVLDGWVPLLPLGGMPLPVLGLAVMAWNDRARRLGDLLAGTVVVPIVAGEPAGPADPADPAETP